MRDSPEKSHILVTQAELQTYKAQHCQGVSQTFMGLDLWELILEMTEALE